MYTLRDCSRVLTHCWRPANGGCSVLSVGSDGCVMQWAMPQQLVARVVAWVAVNPQHQRRPLPADRAVTCAPDGAAAAAAAADALKTAPRRQGESRWVCRVCSDMFCNAMCMFLWV